MMDALNDLMQRERCYGPFRQQDLEQRTTAHGSTGACAATTARSPGCCSISRGNRPTCSAAPRCVNWATCWPALRREMPRALVLRSAKASSFCLGADLHDFAAVDNEADAVRQLVDAHLLAQQLIDLPCPTLAVVHGDTLGGGLELALCCDMRLAAPDARLGLPEILVGLHPGLGATARLPDLIDPLLAMRMVLSGKPLKADAAAQAGLLDGVAAEHALPKLIDDAVKGRLTLQRSNLRARPYRLDWVRRLAAIGLQRRADALVDPAHYPAPSALIDLWRRHGGKPDLMLHREIYSFARLLASGTTGNLIHLFFLRQRLKAEAAPDPRRRANHLHLLGNSPAGVELAALAAQRGLKVSIGDQQAMTQCIRQLAGSEDLQAALDRLIFDPEHHGAALADALIDAQTGDLEARRAKLARLEPQMRPQALLLSLHAALEPQRSALGDAGRLLGVRFAGPVQRGALAELAQPQHRAHHQPTARTAITRPAGLPAGCGKQPTRSAAAPGAGAHAARSPAAAGRGSRDQRHRPGGPGLWLRQGPVGTVG
ncbi:enoyl-CoA hydratase-related protein [Halopseudomonas pachastrellae]|nr:enoyl-CoA hydratase-related protein [Halopseudomonas pachastrellae]